MSDNRHPVGRRRRALGAAAAAWAVSAMLCLGPTAHALELTAKPGMIQCAYHTAELASLFL